MSISTEEIGQKAKVQGRNLQNMQKEDMTIKDQKFTLTAFVLPK